jgi:peptidoglycan L-alanyl-D-glutamate endopeptidase CwlK
MGKYRFAQSSIDMMRDVEPRLAAVMYEAKERAIIDFDVSCGHRSIEEQKKLFDNNRSLLDGTNHKSKHNYFPAKAVDIYAYKGKYADYSKEKMYYLSQIIKESAKDLGVKIRWGGDWKDFVDMPHYELV